MTQYCGARGAHVTTLTIAEDSARYIQRLIDENDLPGEVLLEDFLDLYRSKSRRAWSERQSEAVGIMVR